MKRTFIIAAFLFCSSFAFAQSTGFIGVGGVFFLGAADVPLDQSVYDYDYINGVVIRVKWETLEPQPGVLDWQFVDGEIAKAVIGNKKVSMEVLGKPDWLKDSIGIPHYEYLNQFGNPITDYVSWHPLHVQRLQMLIQALGDKYTTDTTIAYWNLVAGQMSRNLPDTLSDGSIFYQLFDYNPDTLVTAMNAVLDVYMQAFPNTPNWSSMDYQRWEPGVTGHPKNYVAQQYANYGIANYPDRFGVWREDLSGCNPNFQFLNSTSHWFIVQQNPCANGAQMLWSVQDGPTRMNQCGMLPNTKPYVLDSAIKKGLYLGMRYLEIYGADVNDTSLYDLIKTANDSLIARANACNGLVAVKNFETTGDFTIFPNPSNGNVFIEGISDNALVEVYDAFGRLLFNTKAHGDVVTIGELQSGLYFLKVNGRCKKVVIL